MTDEKKKLAIDCGRRVKNEAKRLKITQKKLSAEEHIHMSVSTLRKIYQGDRLISEIQAEELAAFFKVRKEYLLCKDNDRTEEDRKKRLFGESVQHALSASRYQNQILSDACTLTGYKFLDIIADNLSADFQYRLEIGNNRQVDLNQGDLDSWLSGCMQYAAFTLSLLVKQKEQEA